MSEQQKVDVTLAPPLEGVARSGAEIAYDALCGMNVDSLSALKAALRYFAESEGREVSEVRLIKMVFVESGSYLVVRAELEP